MFKSIIGESSRLAQQIEFILEIDKLKAVIRRNLILCGERNENSAEHSWSLGMMAVLLAEHSSEAIDIAHVVKMVLVHDLVEIDAGDTYCYDAAGNVDKEEREKKAADRIFGILPDDQRDELRGLWDEFEERCTAEAKFANSIDRLLPLMQNYQAHGASWKGHGVRVDQARERMAPVREGSIAIADAVDRMIDRALEEGYFRPAERISG